MKWFAKDISKCSKLNTSSLSKQTTIAKKVIRSDRRKMRQDKQHKLTKFYSINTHPKKEYKPKESIIEPLPIMKYPPITSFLSSKKQEMSKSKTAWIQRKKFKSNKIN